MVFASRSLIPTAALALGLAAFGSSRMARAEDSPFMRAAGGVGGNQAGAPPAFELAGASVTAEGAQICIFDSQAKRSRWIAVGATVDRIQVVSYDAKNDRAVIRVDGAQQDLNLRKATVASQAGWQAPAYRPLPGPMITPTPASVASLPPAPPPAPKPAKVLKEEEDARMLVSDLLDISVKQRRAYEEAQQRAAQAPKPQ